MTSQNSSGATIFPIRTHHHIVERGNRCDLTSCTRMSANFGHACANIAGATDAFTPRLTELGGRALFEESKSLEYTPAPITMGFTANPPE